MSDEWIYHLQNARTGAWLHRNLPLRDVEIVDVLTGHCSLTGALGPEDNALDDLIEEWGCFLYAEKPSDPDNPIRFGGILTDSRVSDDGQDLLIDARGFTAYPDGQHYNSLYREWAVDPLVAFRHVWSWLQSRGNSDLGLNIDNETSNVTLGPEQPPPKPGNDDVTYPAGSPYGAQGDPWPRPPKPLRPKRRKPRKRKRREGETWDHWSAYVTAYEEDLAAWEEDYNTLNKGRLKEWRAWHVRLKWHRDQWRQQYGDHEPYKLSWWDQTDCGQELLRLAQEGVFDWREKHTWTDETKTAVHHRLQLGHPTIGLDKSADIVLAVGTSLARGPEVVRGGDRYANFVTGLGTGQGRKMRRVTVGVDDDLHLRRQVSVHAKKVKREKRLKAIAQDERSYRRLVKDIPEVCVWEETGTLGDLRLGDVVSVQAEGIWVSGITKHKIVGRRYRPDDDDVIFLQLVRAERGVPLSDVVPYSNSWLGQVTTEFDGPGVNDPRTLPEYDDSTWTTIALPVGKGDAFPLNVVDPEPWAGYATDIPFTNSVWLRRQVYGRSIMHIRIDGNAWVFLDGVQIGYLPGLSAGAALTERPDPAVDGGGGSAPPIPFLIEGPGMLSLFLMREVRAGYDGHYYDIELEEVVEP